ncbi:MAG: T9SS type A sorting domain-containing protein [Bacteroidota bacterium]
MLKKCTIIIFLVLFVSQVFSQTVISVDADRVVKTFDHNPVGINVNYLMDDDAYLQPNIPLSQSLSNINPGILRFPGGEKSDNYLWSVPPYDSANPHFATPGDCNFPNQDERFSDDFITPLRTTLDFDEFMNVSNAVGAQPMIVVSADAQYNRQCPTPTKLGDLITNAVEWVRYANITNQHNIRYWMIGNESWFASAYDSPATATQYANDLIQFATAMTAVDPTITIVANGDAGPWTDTLMQIAGESIDVIALSNYPAFNWVNGYDTYRDGSYIFTNEITSVISSIGTANTRIIISEYGPLDFTGAWENNNDLGHALVSFQMFGDQIKQERVDGANLWNTRWIDNPTNPQSSFDALDADGNLNATGKALAMWGNNMLDKIVFSDNQGFVNSFATTDQSGSQLNIFLINRDYASQEVVVDLKNYLDVSSPILTITQSKLTGTSPTDEFPVISQPTNGLTLTNTDITLTLDPVSIHVIKISNGTITAIHNRSELEKVEVYPNPAHDYVNISHLPGELNSAKLLTVHGNIVKKYHILDDNGKLSLEGYPSGLYFLQINTKGQVITKRITKR